MGGRDRRHEDAVVADELPPYRSDARLPQHGKQLPPLGIAHVAGRGARDRGIDPPLCLLSVSRVAPRHRPPPRRRTPPRGPTARTPKLGKAGWRPRSALAIG